MPHWWLPIPLSTPKRFEKYKKMPGALRKEVTTVVEKENNGRLIELYFASSLQAYALIYTEPGTTDLDGIFSAFETAGTRLLLAEEVGSAAWFAEGEAV